MIANTANNMGESIGIVGAGITGLATALVLSSNHTNITIVARDMPGDLGLKWSSPWAGAVFHPQITTSETNREMQRSSFRYYWSLAQTDSSSASSVKIYPMTEYFDDRSDDTGIWYRSLMPDFCVIQSSELPPGVTFGVKYTSLCMNPILLLPWLKEKLLASSSSSGSVKFIRVEVNSIEEARTLTNADVIVNASGLGAKSLAGDDSVRAVRGQTMFVKTTFKEIVMREGSEYTYIIPRASSGGVILGGIKQEGRADADADMEVKIDILKRVNGITNGAFKDVDLRAVTDIVGFRPGRKGGLRVEKVGNVVHAYGVEGAGYIYSFGVAERVRELIEGGAGIVKEDS